MYDERIKGAITRSNRDWCEQGEPSSEYVCDLEKSKQKSNVIKMLLINIKPLTPKEIYLAIGNFYKC